jgi:hypothetical protein
VRLQRGITQQKPDEQ